MNKKSARDAYNAAWQAFETAYTACHAVGYNVKAKIETEDAANTAWQAVETAYAALIARGR